MPRIYVEFSKLKTQGDKCKTVATKVDTIKSDFQTTIRQLDTDVLWKDNIQSTANQLAQKLAGYSAALKKYQTFITQTHDAYVKLDNEKFDGKLVDIASIIAPQSSNDSNIISQLADWLDRFSDKLDLINIIPSSLLAAMFLNPNAVNLLKMSTSGNNIILSGMQTLKGMAGPVQSSSNLKGFSIMTSVEAAKVFDAFGKVLMWGTAAIKASNEIFFTNQDKSIERRVSNGVLEAGVSVVGTLAAVKVGAAAGAAVGSIIPGAGTAVGAAAGAIIGGAVGIAAGYAVSWGIDKAWDSIKEPVKNYVGNAVEGASNWVKSLFNPNTNVGNAYSGAGALRTAY